MQTGLPGPLGATLTEQGVNFAIFSSHATRIEVALYDPLTGAERVRCDLPSRTGDVWHGFFPAPRAGRGTCYAFYVHGPRQPELGHRFDPNMPLSDPYARDFAFNHPLHSRVGDERFDWTADRHPAIPWRDTVIYELHVKGFTQLHPEVPPALRGKYLGLTVPAVLEYLKNLGVTAVELMPCHAFLSEPLLRQRGLTNYWGYNPFGWFAPANAYAIENAVTEFKTMVRALHAAGLEVILDVVFNHTAEGNEHGPMLNLKGIDNAVYYRLAHDKRTYDNVTGCGNTVNCAHPHVRALIVECLKYWADVMRVDGFRFDLAPVLARDARGFDAHSPIFKALHAEPSLEGIKLIAEPWDVGSDGYQLGRFPAGWAEWNDRYRDSVRSFWRGDPGRVGELAERFAGSSDLFRHNGRKPTANINFVAAHDGFTLHDLVSYDEPDNEANLEGNMDGARNNMSWNCGVEGPSQDTGVLTLRRRQMRNMLATLMLSQGVPMLQAGDEFGRTQRGNNNAYCQDNELSWINWEGCRTNRDLVEFVRLLTRLRREHAELRRETFLKGTASRTGVKDVSWLHLRGGEMTDRDWQDGEVRTLGALFGNRHNTAHRLLYLMNACDTALEFKIPEVSRDSPWVCRFDTARAESSIPIVDASGLYPLAANSAALLEC